jgi:mono/diheme cytochrome c family protein
MPMSGRQWLYLILAVALGLLVLLAIRMHSAAAQGAPQGRGNAEAGRLAAQAWCTECHSVERETAGTGRFAPDFTAVANRRSARWIHAYLRSPHVRMPDFEFDPPAADNIVAYIVSLKRR